MHLAISHVKSYGLAGVLTEHVGPMPMLLWGGVIGAAIVSLGLFSRSVRQLD